MRGKVEWMGREVTGTWRDRRCMSDSCSVLSPLVLPLHSGVPAPQAPVMFSLRSWGRTCNHSHACSSVFLSNSEENSLGYPDEEWARNRQTPFKHEWVLFFPTTLPWLKLLGRSCPNPKWQPFQLPRHKVGEVERSWWSKVWLEPPNCETRVPVKSWTAWCWWGLGGAGGVEPTSNHCCCVTSDGSSKASSGSWQPCSYYPVSPLLFSSVSACEKALLSGFAFLRTSHFLWSSGCCVPSIFPKRLSCTFLLPVLGFWELLALLASRILKMSVIRVRTESGRRMQYGPIHSVSSDISLYRYIYKCQGKDLEGCTSS